MKSVISASQNLAFQYQVPNKIPVHPICPSGSCAPLGTSFSFCTEQEHDASLTHSLPCDEFDELCCFDAGWRCSLAYGSPIISLIRLDVTWRPGERQVTFPVRGWTRGWCSIKDYFSDSRWIGATQNIQQFFKSCWKTLWILAVLL